MSKSIDDILSIFKDDERIYVNNEYIIGKIQELALKYDEKLISTILNNAEIKLHFFIEVGGALIFKREEFIEFIGGKYYLEDSYTKYRNKIGLAVDNSYIKENRDVVLNWAYKDCVLEGGQSKDEVKQDEVFYNTILAHDDIDKLYDKKVLTAFKKITKDGEEKKFNMTDNDNLIIKGNNLIAMKSIQNKFKEKVKLIYIDPPYNTGNDSFKYNDKFNHSTWLTFMKNRLEIAKDLLRNDGFIMIQIDDTESAYLKILCDEVFGRENFRNNIFWKRTFAGKTATKNLPSNVDTILLYSKKESTLLEEATKELTEEDKKGYNKDDNDGRGKYTTVSLQKTDGPTKGTAYDYIDNNGVVWKCPKKGWRMVEEKLKALENDNRLYFTESTIREKYYLEERLKVGKQLDNFWDDIGNMNRNKKENLNFVGQKPEQLIERIIKLTTKEKDIVLDYHLGTGTTCAVAHKMNRQYIGIEQMDYIENITVERIKNILKGDDTNLSKKINWEGGGSFIYCELMKWNEVFIKKINNATLSNQLVEIWNEIKEKAFLSYRIKVNQIDKSINEFEALSLEQQKEFLIEVLDKNHLYVNLSEIDDITYNVSDEDKKLNKEFYGLK